MSDTISRRLVAARTARGIAPIALATAVGIDRSQLSRYETGAAAPSVPVLVRLAEVLETSVDYLVGRTDELAAAGPDTTAIVQALGRLRTAETAIVADLIHIMNERRVTP